ncbi:hypothetical protein LJK87_43230 [Paenibacillus sp. P25]|nr:hypothetical protein LJK87_43230 [Paenibacillus sp. P25]
MTGKERVYRWAVVLYLLVWFTGDLWVMGLLRSGVLTGLAGLRIASVEEYAYCMLAGAVGGSLYALRPLHEYYDQLTERWILWYLLRPIKCGGAP